MDRSSEKEPAQGPVESGGWAPLTLEPVPRPGAHRLRRGPVPRFRRYWVRVLLAVVTLGLYALWWHWVTHRELCDYLGRPNPEQKIWFAYIGLHVLLLGGYLVLLALVAGRMFGFGLPGGMETAAGWLAGGTLLVVAAGAVVSLGIFVWYVGRQIERLREAKSVLGGTVRLTPFRFFGFYFGGLVVQVLFPVVGVFGVVAVMAAYWFLQEEYNDVHLAAHDRGIARTQLGEPVPVPG